MKNATLSAVQEAVMRHVLLESPKLILSLLNSIVPEALSPLHDAVTDATPSNKASSDQPPLPAVNVKGNVSNAPNNVGPSRDVALSPVFSTYLVEALFSRYACLEVRVEVNERLMGPHIRRVMSRALPTGSSSLSPSHRYTNNHGQQFQRGGSEEDVEDEKSSPDDYRRRSTGAAISPNIVTTFNRVQCEAVTTSMDGGAHGSSSGVVGATTVPFQIMAYRLVSMGEVDRGLIDLSSLAQRGGAPTAAAAAALLGSGVPVSAAASGALTSSCLSAVPSVFPVQVVANLGAVSSNHAEQQQHRAAYSNMCSAVERVLFTDTNVISTDSLLHALHRMILDEKAKQQKRIDTQGMVMTFGDQEVRSKGNPSSSVMSSRGGSAQKRVEPKAFRESKLIGRRKAKTEVADASNNASRFAPSIPLYRRGEESSVDGVGRFIFHHDDAKRGMKAKGGHTHSEQQHRTHPAGTTRDLKHRLRFQDDWDLRRSVVAQKRKKDTQGGQQPQRNSVGQPSTNTHQQSPPISRGQKNATATAGSTAVQAYLESLTENDIHFYLPEGDIQERTAPEGVPRGYYWSPQQLESHRNVYALMCSTLQDGDLIGPNNQRVAPGDLYAAELTLNLSLSHAVEDAEAALSSTILAEEFRKQEQDTPTMKKNQVLSQIEARTRDLLSEEYTNYEEDNEKTICGPRRPIVDFSSEPKSYEDRQKLLTLMNRNDFPSRMLHPQSQQIEDDESVQHVSQVAALFAAESPLLDRRAPTHNSILPKRARNKFLPQDFEATMTSSEKAGSMAFVPSSQLGTRNFEGHVEGVEQGVVEESPSGSIIVPVSTLFFGRPDVPRIPAVPCEMRKTRQLRKDRRDANVPSTTNLIRDASSRAQHQQFAALQKLSSIIDELSQTPIESSRGSTTASQSQNLSKRQQRLNIIYTASHDVLHHVFLPSATDLDIFESSIHPIEQEINCKFAAFEAQLVQHQEDAAAKRGGQETVTLQEEPEVRIIDAPTYPQGFTPDPTNPTNMSRESPLHQRSNGARDPSGQSSELYPLPKSNISRSTANEEVGRPQLLQEGRPREGPRKPLPDERVGGAAMSISDPAVEGEEVRVSSCIPTNSNRLAPALDALQRAVRNVSYRVQRAAATIQHIQRDLSFARGESLKSDACRISQYRIE